MEGRPDPAGSAALAALSGAGLEISGGVRSRRGFLLGPELAREQVESFATEVLADPVTDEITIFAPGEDARPSRRRVTIAPLPGVTDPVARSVAKALTDADLPAVATGTYTAFETEDGVSAEALAEAALAAVANDAIEQVRIDEIPPGLPGAGQEPNLDIQEVSISKLDGEGLFALSKDGGLALNEQEMLVVQKHFREAAREPTRLELETIAQTWSEHCKHKTLTGLIRFNGEIVDNLLRSTIAKVTTDLDRDFCISVFKDNAGIIAFDDEDALCIKVETHNHPSAIEPFGGAATGIGGVIRDVLGTGLGARPVASTDVFCFAPLDMPAADIPKGCLHPSRILRGVVTGVRDYGNPMGIPTVNGSVHFDPAFVGNPLVYVGTVGILPRDKAFKQPRPGDIVLAIGGKTGRDGIHGATFSSLELHTDSEEVSSGAVQIGDPITERKAMDAVLRASAEDLFTSITDCGAGGFSSAVGEMGEEIGAEVDLATIPLKYQGLAPWEIWISEAQERMVLSVPPENIDRVMEICDEEDVEATSIGTFTDEGRLIVKFAGVVHADLDMKFLHDGVPRLEREATWTPPELDDPDLDDETDFAKALLTVLGDPNIASKEWIIRQYDHEVQAGSAGKPLVGACNDGPADAAVVAPKLGSRRGLVLANGLNPRYSKIDPAAMAECALDEAMRNLVASGGDPEFTAVLDNYCWGNTNDPQRLGELVRASFALHDLALAYHTPFVSGKDSLNNEFRDGDRLISIPGCILVTAMSVIKDVTKTITSDLKAVGNLIVLVGSTQRELGGSVYWKQRGALGNCVPRVEADRAKRTLDAVALTIQNGTVASCHDLSEGGLGAAVAEMAIGGRLGAAVNLDRMPATDPDLRPEEKLFSESQSRFLLEIAPDHIDQVTSDLDGVDFAIIGAVTDDSRVAITHRDQPLLALPIETMVEHWKQPLDLDGTLTAGGLS